MVTVGYWRIGIALFWCQTDIYIMFHKRNNTLIMSWLCSRRLPATVYVILLTDHWYLTRPQFEIPHQIGWRALSVCVLAQWHRLFYFLAGKWWLRCSFPCFVFVAHLFQPLHWPLAMRIFTLLLGNWRTCICSRVVAPPKQTAMPNFVPNSCNAILLTEPVDRLNSIESAWGVERRRERGPPVSWRSIS